MERACTGQKITDGTVICPVCKEKTGLRNGGATGLAYFDRFRGKKGQYVHYRCLSQARLDEILQTLQNVVESAE